MAGKVGDEFEPPAALAWVKRDAAGTTSASSSRATATPRSGSRRPSAAACPTSRPRPDALPAMVKPENVAFFDKYGVLNEAEVRGRYVSKAEQYSKLLNIEANTMVYMARSLHPPALFDYSGDIAHERRHQGRAGHRGRGREGARQDPDQRHQRHLRGHGRPRVQQRRRPRHRGPAGPVRCLPRRCHPEHWSILRAFVDAMEKICGADDRPVPSYNSLLFWV